jgi:hypothetical protein
MRLYYLIAALTALFVIGCSSTYTIGDFSSWNNFYNDFNKSAKNRIIEITLNNDSTFTAEGGARIINDSLFFNTLIHKKEKISQNEISKILYNNNVNEILLKNRDSLLVKSIYKLSDSSIIVSDIENTEKPLPIIYVKKISYKNHLLGVPGGLGYGLLSGFLSGFIITELIPNDKAHQDRVYGVLVGTPIGILLGGIWGFIEGYTYTYEFNP